ncbi:hypothetical protein HORIV_53100 [Vreelandella olivaria]|uniref:Aldehyde dehydrogenase n=1 Tax=Vreelandella olivaria TaxID=390919 RepID=A0ABN5X0X6_9GAMM|nr:hypothetical protein HORIV_53100 [Halomonas olivaria]
MIYANPGDTGSVVSFEKRYGNYIGGEFVAPVKGQYFDNISPVNGHVFCEIPAPRQKISIRHWMLPTKRRLPGAKHQHKSAAIFC